VRYPDAFDIARNAAGKTHPIVTRYKHSSVLLDRKGRIISVGRNYFAGTVIEGDDGGLINKTVHSEIHALAQVNIRRLDGCTILNYGKTKVASILARPCDSCWIILKKLGLKKVFYTIRSDLHSPTWREEFF
jgi:deoxycytidylate deaminase